MTDSTLANLNAAIDESLDGKHNPARRSRRTNSPSETLVDLGKLLSNVEVFIRKYVVLEDNQAAAVTLWTAHTHVIDAFDCTPYEQITSATLEAGKTRLLEVQECVVARPWLTQRTSAAVLVRKIDGEAPTLLLDESDAAFNGDREYAEALRGLLNAGYRRSGKASLCVGQGSNITYRDFRTFCPKAIAGIGKLPDTVASRSIKIELKRRTKDEPVAKFRERETRREAEPVRQALAAWSKEAIPLLRDARPSMPTGLRDRAEDVWEPLFAIADAAGGLWPDRARRAAVELTGGLGDVDMNIELIHDIAGVFTDIKTDWIATQTLIQHLVALEERPWGTWRKGDKPITPDALARRLKPFGIIPASNGSVRGYERSKFRDAWSRYPPNNPSTRQSSNVSGPDSALSTRQSSQGVDGLKTEKTSTTTDLLDGLTGQQPDDGEDSPDGDGYLV